MVESNATLFGKWLKEKRKSRGLSQQMLADLVGCSLAMIEKLEAGSRKPSWQIAQLLADHLDISPDDKEDFIAFARGETGIEPGRGHLVSPIRTNLPYPLSSLIGREQEISVVCDLLSRPQVRLLTLTGSPGTGKTRLSVECARALLGTFPEGVFFVELAAVSDPLLVIPAIARVLDLPDTGKDPADKLAGYLHDKRVLLVLDNFEQVVEAGPLLSQLLERCAGLKALVTSRELLRLRGERRFEVPPLAFPYFDRLGEDTKALTETDFQAYSAIRLFAERAGEIGPNFAITEENVRTIASICARLEGLPLAIELAAARSRLFPPEAMLPGLDSALTLLVDGARDLPPRHRTLLDAIAWSYELLGKGEQILFARLGIFIGGCTLAAAEAVCNADGDLPFDVATGIESLLNKGLLKRQEEQGPTRERDLRFTMLETVREYALRRLADGPSTCQGPGLDRIRQLHAEYCMALAEASEGQLAGREQKRFLDILDIEHDNLRATLAWSLEGSPEWIVLAARLAGSLGRFWRMRGHVTEGRRWFDRIIERSSAGSVSPGAQVMGKLVLAAATLAGIQDDHARAEELYQSALTLYRSLADKRGEVESLKGLAAVASARRDLELSASLLEESLALSREVGDIAVPAGVLNNLGMQAINLGHYEQAISYLEESLALKRRLGDVESLARTLNNLGKVALDRGDYERATALFTESLDLKEEVQSDEAAMSTLINLGEIALYQANYSTAKSCFQKCLALSRKQAAVILEARALENLGHTALSEGDVAGAKSFFEEGLALGKRLEHLPRICPPLTGLGHLALHLGRREQALAILMESLELNRGQKLDRTMARSLIGVASVAGSWGPDERRHAVRLHAAAEAVLVKTGASANNHPPYIRSLRERDLADLRCGVDPTSFNVAWDEGTALGMQEAIVYSLDVLQRLQRYN